MAVTYKAEEYRAKARECEERAERTGDYFIKEQLLEVAKKWRLLPNPKKSARGRPAPRIDRKIATVGANFHQVQSRYVLGAGQS